MSTPRPYECAALGCTAQRRETNHWFVVFIDSNGIHIYEWDKAPDRAMEEGYHFCGIAHTMGFLSKKLTPETVLNPARESTLKLKPLNREGKESE
jgi:hypothetical protein